MQDDLISRKEALDACAVSYYASNAYKKIEAIPSADAVSREDIIGYIDRVSNSGIGKKKALEYIRKYVGRTESADITGHWMPFEKVADMLSWMFGKCACDVNDNDDWLPLACKYADTECPDPKEENGCWMQFLLQGGADMRGDSE